MIYIILTDPLQETSKMSIITYIYQSLFEEYSRYLKKFDAH